MSALQISRMLGITCKSVWFICHRIREQMTPARRSPIGGQLRTVESDETVIGGKAKNRAYAKKPPKKVAVLTLVDRDGDSHSFHVAKVKAKTLREAIVCVVDRKHASANAGERRPPRAPPPARSRPLVPRAARATGSPSTTGRSPNPLPPRTPAEAPRQSTRHLSIRPFLLPRSHALVRAIAKRLICTGFAPAPPNLPGLGGTEFLRRQAHRVVRAVAEGLARAAPTGAPPIVPPSFDIDAVGRPAACPSAAVCAGIGSAIAYSPLFRFH